MATGPVLPHRLRQTLVTLHIIVSVGLLGDSAGFLAVAILASNTTDPESIVELTKVLKMFSLVFGIPLSFASLITGVTLGLGTKWGVLRYPWVVAKLLLVVSVMAVGGFVIGPALTATLENGRDATAPLVVAGVYDVVALTLATALSVFKPGKRFRQPAMTAS